MPNNLLDDKLVAWIKDELEEKQLAQKVKDIISADIAFSEKFYRFLKLCGVLSEKELTDIFKKLRLKEFEVEKELKITKVKNGIQQRLKERMSRIFREGIGGSLAGWGIGCGILFAIAAPIIDYANLSTAFYRGAGQSRFNPPAKMPSLPDGSISDAAGMGLLLGIFIGFIICLNQRSNRANKVPVLPEEERELSLETKAIEEELVRKIAGVDEEILQIKKGISTTKPISKEGFSGAIVDPKISVKIPIVILSTLVIILLIPTINAFKIPSHPIFAPVCSDANDITLKPPLGTVRVQLRPNCWSGWIWVDTKSVSEWRVDGKKQEYLFWDGAYYKEGKYRRGKHWGSPFRLRGEEKVTFTIKFKKEVENIFSTNLSGEWEGRVGSRGRDKPAKLYLRQERVKLSGKIIYEGVEEKLEGEIKSDGQIVLKGISYQWLNSREGVFNLDAFYGTMPDKNHIKGTYKDKAGKSGEWSVARVSEK